MTYTTRKFLVAASRGSTSMNDPEIRVRLIKELNNLYRILALSDKDARVHALKIHEMELEQGEILTDFVAEIHRAESTSGDVNVKALTEYKVAAMNNLAKLQSASSNYVLNLAAEADRMTQGLTGTDKNKAAWMHLFNKMLAEGALEPEHVRSWQDVQMLEQRFGNPDAYFTEADGADFTKAKKFSEHFGRVEDGQFDYVKRIEAFDKSFDEGIRMARAGEYQGAVAVARKLEDDVYEFLGPSAKELTPAKLAEEAEQIQQESENRGSMEATARQLESEIWPGGGQSDRTKTNAAKMMSNDVFRQYAAEHGYEIGKGGFNEDGSPWYLPGKHDFEAVIKFSEDAAKDPTAPQRRGRYAPLVTVTEYVPIPGKADDFVVGEGQYAYVDEYYDADRGEYFPMVPGEEPPGQVYDPVTGESIRPDTRRRYLSAAEYEDRVARMPPAAPAGLAGTPTVRMTVENDDAGQPQVFVRTADSDGAMKMRADGALMAATVTENARIPSGAWNVAVKPDGKAYADYGDVLVSVVNADGNATWGKVKQDLLTPQAADGPGLPAVFLTPDEVEEINKKAGEQAGPTAPRGVTLTSQPPAAASVAKIYRGRLYTHPVPGGKAVMVLTQPDGNHVTFDPGDRRYGVETIRPAGKVHPLKSGAEMFRAKLDQQAAERAARAPEGSIAATAPTSGREVRVERWRQNLVARQQMEGILPEDRRAEKQADRQKDQELARQARQTALAEGWTTEEDTLARTRIAADEAAADAAATEKSAQVHRDTATEMDAEAAALRNKADAATDSAEIVKLDAEARKYEKEAVAERKKARAEDRQAASLSNDAVREMRRSRKLRAAAGEAQQVEVERLKASRDRLQQEIDDNEALPPSERSDMTSSRARLRQIDEALTEARAGGSPKPEVVKQRVEADAGLPDAGIVDEGPEAAKAESKALEGERLTQARIDFDKFVADQMTNLKKLDPEKYPTSESARAAVLEQFDAELQPEIADRYSEMVSEFKATGGTVSEAKAAEILEAATEQVRLRAAFNIEILETLPTPEQQTRMADLAKSTELPESETETKKDRTTKFTTKLDKAQPWANLVDVLRSRRRTEQSVKDEQAAAAETVWGQPAPSTPSAGTDKKVWISPIDLIKANRAKRKKEREEKIIEEASQEAKNVVDLTRDVPETAYETTP